MGDHSGIKQVLAEFKIKVKEIYGERLKDIVLYGSWARGEATQESDIDLLIVLRGRVIPGKEIDRIIEVITDINIRYGVLVSVCPVGENDYLTINSPLFINVRREGVVS